jgi:hypothetical protein
MAYYQDNSEVVYKPADVFTPTYKPGTICPHSGIYICINCRDETACNKGDPLPPQNHRQHTDLTKPILWRLLVSTQPGPNSR